jgi:hypothetical protein
VLTVAIFSESCKETLTALCEEGLEAVLDRKAGAAVRAFTLAVLGLVLAAAAKGVVHSRAAEANRTAVFNFVNDTINQNLSGDGTIALPYQTGSGMGLSDLGSAAHKQ